MATVITNLLSAIPFIGADIVPFIIISPLYYMYYYVFNNSLLKEKKKNLINKEKVYLLNKEKKKELIQENLSFIVGFIDGDGYIRITKKKEYIYISLVINLHEGDYNLLCEIREILGIGNVFYITSKKKKYARLEINKRDLKNSFIPMLEEYNIKFLTEVRQKQYLTMKYIFNNNIIFYKDINNKMLEEYINKNIILKGFKELNNFNNWLVGFTTAEGSFCKKKNNDICFKLKQKYNLNLFKEILVYFNSTQKLYIKDNKYVEYTISSTKDIQKIIYFFSYNDYEIKPNIKHATISLKGLKLISYNKWLLEIKISKRYGKLDLPKVINII